MLDAPPTALLIVVDEEGPWGTAYDRSKKIRTLKGAVRGEVALLGGSIGNDVLDQLIHVRTWGSDGCYELANFTDDELIAALHGPRDTGQLQPKVSEATTRANLAAARRLEVKLDAVVGPCRVSKPGLAVKLWPVLHGKAEREIADGALITPVVRVLADAVDVAVRLHPKIRIVGEEK